MRSDWERLNIKPNELYRPKELGGKGWGQKGLLGVSYDTVIREIVDNPKYSASIVGTWNKARTYRSNIIIPGWVAIQWLEDNKLG
jgi:hypothetical protein